MKNNFNDQNNPVSNLRWANNTMKHLQFLRIYLQVLFASYEPIPILLKSTSPEGEVRFFGTIKEASEGLGFSERGLGKAYPQVGIELVNISYIYVRYNS